MSKHKYGKSKTDISRQVKQRKRDEAAERQAVYDSLSIEDKLQIISARRGKSVKEVKQLRSLQKV